MAENKKWSAPRPRIRRPQRTNAFLHSSRTKRKCQIMNAMGATEGVIPANWYRGTAQNAEKKWTTGRNAG